MIGEWYTFDELGKQQLYDILALRQRVFVLEQKSLYEDLDYLDQQAMHLLCKKNGVLAGYLRLFMPNVRYPNAASFGRVVAAPGMRKTGVGKYIVSEAMQYFETQNIAEPIYISAQLYLQKFYETFGFVTDGDVYDEDGIPHIKMIYSRVTT